MARDLIETYAAEVRAALSWRTDRDDIADELEAHLRDKADHFTAGGSGSRDAQRLAITCMGTVSIVADSFARNAAGHLAVPSRFTRIAGAAGLAAACAWLATIGVAAVAGSPQPGQPANFYANPAWGLVLALAVTLSTLTLVGVLARTGTLRAGRGIPVVATASTIVVAGTVFGLGAHFVLLVAAAAYYVTIASGAEQSERIVRPLRGLAVWVVAATAALISDGVGPASSVIDYSFRPLAALVAFTVCAAVSAWALFATGLRLRSERPARLALLGALRDA